MTYNLATAQATIDQRLQEARTFRLARALKLRERAKRTNERARQALTSLNA
ncbi:hypothetical protein ACIRBX_00530 [Kitasatospora sp. NPDC096147]|uniref:hypothetical protein n=1 Tax=Kitasatospora sp. NPDC096147 TaxID=3364093 RepID=UPI00380BB19B